MQSKKRIIRSKEGGEQNILMVDKYNIEPRIF